MNLTERIKTKAIELGFDLVGIAPAARAPHAKAFEHWLDNNYHAHMQWLAKNPHRRQDPRRVIEGTQSVVVVGLSYFVLNPGNNLWDDPSRGRIARYAWGLDYHNIMLPRLRELGNFIDTEARQKLNQRSYVDTGPVLEREFAAQAGLGFVGKNSLLISPKMGSYLFLGEILVDIVLDYDEPATADGAQLRIPLSNNRERVGTCGNCTRCLGICPTRAFPAPYVVNSNRCISYLTIEHKGAIPTKLRPLMQNWIYGCDACQEVCPWVRRYATDYPTREVFLQFNPDQVAPKLTNLMAMDDDAFRRRFKGTPIKRTKRRGLLRNVAIALGNWGSPQALSALETALTDPEPLIREHAAWAIAQIK